MASMSFLCALFLFKSIRWILKSGESISRRWCQAIDSHFYRLSKSLNDIWNENHFAFLLKITSVYVRGKCIFMDFEFIVRDRFIGRKSSVKRQTPLSDKISCNTEWRLNMRTAEWKRDHVISYQNSLFLQQFGQVILFGINFVWRTKQMWYGFSDMEVIPSVLRTNNNCNKKKKREIKFNEWRRVERKKKLPKWLQNVFVVVICRRTNIRTIRTAMHNNDD